MVQRVGFGRSIEDESLFFDRDQMTHQREDCEQTGRALPHQKEKLWCCAWCLRREEENEDGFDDERGVHHPGLRR